MDRIAIIGCGGSGKTAVLLRDELDAGPVDRPGPGSRDWPTPVAAATA